MKNRFKKIFFAFLCFISVSFYNVYAISGTAFVVGSSIAGGIVAGRYIYCNVDMDHNCSQFDVASYDNNLSIFDVLSVRPVCSTHYTIRQDISTNEYYVFNDNWSGYNNISSLCDRGVSPSLEKLLEYFPYVIRFNYKNINTNDVYYLFYFFDNIPELDISTNRTAFRNVKFAMTNVPDNYLIDNSLNIYANDKVRYNYNGTYDYLTYYSTRDSMSYGSYGYQDFPTLFLTNLNSNNYFQTTLSSNFDLSLIHNGEYNLSNTISNYTYNLVNGFEFNTDVDLTIKPNEYVLLVPKKNSSFSGYFWSDNIFAFSEDYFNSNITSFEDNIISGGFNSIAFNALNEYPWFRWDYSFTTEELEDNRVLRIYNQNENKNLNIKLFSSDFFYNVYNKNSGSVVINGIEYPNDYDYMYNLGLKYPDKSVYEIKDQSSSIDFIKSLPNLLSTFVSSFAFIGTLFTTFFSIFTGELQIYFYVVFGLMIIMLLINIMK